MVDFAVLLVNEVIELGVNEVLLLHIFLRFFIRLIEVHVVEEHWVCYHWLFLLFLNWNIVDWRFVLEEILLWDSVIDRVIFGLHAMEYLIVLEHVLVYFQKEVGVRHEFHTAFVIIFSNCLVILVVIANSHRGLGMFLTSSDMDNFLGTGNFILAADVSKVKEHGLILGDILLSLRGTRANIGTLFLVLLLLEVLLFELLHILKATLEFKIEGLQLLLPVLNILLILL